MIRNEKEFKNIIFKRKFTIEIIDEWLKNGGDINITEDLNNDTMLHISCYNLDLDKIIYLLNKGIDPLLKNRFNYNSLDICIVKKRIDIVLIIIEFIKNEIPKLNLNDYILDDYKIISKLLEYGIDPNKKSNYGWNSLISACKIDNYEKVKLLINYNANVNDVDYSNNSVLMWSVKYSTLEINKLLIDKGAIINYHNQHGDSPLTSAISYGRYDIFCYLIDMDAKITKKNIKKLLLEALNFDRINIFKLLVKNNYSINKNDLKNVLNSCYKNNKLYYSLLLKNNKLLNSKMKYKRLNTNLLSKKFIKNI